MQAGTRFEITATSPLRYIAAARPLHQSLQQVLTQTAGYALLVFTRAKPLILLDGPVVAASQALAIAADCLAALRVSADTAHHHRHLCAAARALRRALDNLEACLRPAADDAVRNTLTKALRSATDHLRSASRALPGFEMVDLTQACCATHGARGLICQGEMREDLRHG